MNRRKSIYKFLSKLLIFIAIAEIAYVAPKHAAAADVQEWVSDCLNTTSKYLYLGNPNADTYDFNVKVSAQEKGAAYTWYVNTEKGSRNSIIINKKTGLVTAKEAGTAYITCKITYKDGMVIRSEAKVTVRNNITEVAVSNLPEKMTIPAGTAADFNRTVCNTQAGAVKKTNGITRWEIADDTAGAGSASDCGIVYPVKAGTFKLRAVCFQSGDKYRKWLENKDQNKKYVTAASDWHTIKVAAASGKATANTQEQLNKVLASNEFTQITLSTQKAQKFLINAGDYSSKSLCVNAPNADVENHGTFKDIRIEAIKDTTWIEYANGNIVYLSDNQLSFVIDTDADVKQIVVDKPNSTVNFDIRGKVEQISVLQPSRINISGSSTGIPVLVDKNAGGSTISTSIPLNLTLNADADISLNQGAEGSSLDKSARSIKVKIENQSKQPVSITINKTGGEVIGAGATGLSNEATSTAAVPTGGNSYIANPNVSITGLTITPSTIVLSVSGSALAVLTAIITPANASDQMVTWSSADESVAAVDSDGAVTPVAEGTTSIIAAAGNVYATATVRVVSGSALAVSGGALSIGKLKSVQSAIATGLLASAASYVGSESMGWGLNKVGLGVNDAASREMVELNKLSNELTNLQNEMADIEVLLKQSGYDSRMTAFEPVMNYIKNMKDALIVYLNSDKDNPDVENQIISSINENMLKYKFYIYQQLVGSDNTVPLLKILSSAVASRHRFLSKEDSDQLQKMFDCFKKIQEAELYLLVELYHEQSSVYSTKDIQDLIGAFLHNIEEEQKLLLPSVPENVLIDKDQNIMIYGGYYCKPYGPNKDKKIPGPWHGSINSNFIATYFMCYNLNYTDWRLITVNELVSMSKDCKGNLITYLQSKGWVTPLLSDYMELAVTYETNPPPTDDYLTTCFIVDADGNTSTRDIKTDQDTLAFTWLTVRTMDYNELSWYFWK